MPIVDKINALTGKSAETIEDAIANMSGGGSGAELVDLGVFHGGGGKIDQGWAWEFSSGTTFETNLYDLIGDRKVVNCIMDAEPYTDSKGATWYISGWAILYYRKTVDGVSIQRDIRFATKEEKMNTTSVAAKGMAFLGNAGSTQEVTPSNFNVHIYAICV